jgi:tetratricopeptide (TPR) repeat protein
MRKWVLLGAVSIMMLLFFIPLIFRPPINNTNTPRNLIESNRQRGRIMQALYQTEAQASRTGWTVDLLLVAGDLWQEAGDVTRAVPYWQAAAQAGDSGILRRLAQTQIDLQNWADAADTLTQLIESDSENFWAHYQIGIIRAAFDPQTAESHLRIAGRSPEYGEDAAAVLRALSDDPMDVGIALAEAEVWSYAELAFQHAADLGQSYPEALAYTGLMRDHQGKDGGAWIEQAVKIASQNPLVRYLQAIHLRLTGDYDASLEAMIQAVALDPQNPGLYAELGTSYWLTAVLDKAEYWLEFAVDLSDNDPRYQQMLDQFRAEETSRIDEILQSLDNQEPP